MTDKAAIRRAALAARAEAAAAPDAGARQDRARARLVALLGPARGRVLAGYLPMRGEVDPRPVMTAWDGPVCVPVVEGRGQPLTFRRWTQDAPLIEGAFKAMIPAEGETLVPDVLIVPLSAYTAAGDRLGYGGGFYDRTLARLPRADAVGLAYRVQEVPRLPVEPTDVRLRAIATD